MRNLLILSGICAAAGLVACNSGGSTTTPTVQISNGIYVESIENISGPNTVATESCVSLLTSSESNHIFSDSDEATYHVYVRGNQFCSDLNSIDSCETVNVNSNPSYVINSDASDDMNGSGSLSNFYQLNNNSYYSNGRMNVSGANINYSCTFTYKLTKQVI